MTLHCCLYDVCCLLCSITHLYLTDDSFGQVTEGKASHGGIVQCYGTAAIATLADTLYHRDLTQERYSHLLSQTFASLLPEDVVFVLGKFGWSKPGHILHQSKDGDIYFVIGKHIDTLTRISQCDLLWSAHDDSTRNGYGLECGKVYVACARRQVYKEIVEITPCCIANKLLQGIARHTSTPDSRLCWIHEEANRKELYAIAFYGNAPEIRS